MTEAKTQKILPTRFNADVQEDTIQTSTFILASVVIKQYTRILYTVSRSLYIYLLYSQWSAHCRINLYRNIWEKKKNKVVLVSLADTFWQRTAITFNGQICTQSNPNQMFVASFFFGDTPTSNSIPFWVISWNLLFIYYSPIIYAK